MSESLGPLSYAKGEDQIFLGREIAHNRDYSEETARRIDEEISNLVNRSYTKARQVLEENMDILHRLSDLLLEKETVMGEELDELIFSLRPGIQLPSARKHAEEKPAAEGPSEGEAETEEEEEEADSTAE
jgi:cell division protease FtsH